jgi:putative transcriptional regulator
VVCGEARSAMMEGMQLASGMLLVATPALQDPNFVDTVVLLLDVND